MQIQRLESMQANDDNTPINPFLQDAFNMGQYVGTNVAIMFRNFESENCPYLIVIDRITGERIRIVFDADETARTISGSFMIGNPA